MKKSSNDHNFNRVNRLKSYPPVRKTPVPDRPSSEKPSEELASLKPAENSQNCQI